MDMKNPLSFAQCVVPTGSPRQGYTFVVNALSTDDVDWITYCVDKYAIVCDLANPQNGRVFGGCSRKLHVSCFSPSGTYLAAGGIEGQVYIWEQKSQELYKKCSGPANIYDISWSEDETMICVVGENGGRVFEVSTDSNFGGIQGHSKPILSCSFRPTTPLTIFSCSSDYYVIAHSGDVQAEEPFDLSKKHKKHKGMANCVRISPNGEFAVSVGSDKKINLYTGDGNFVKTFPDSKTSHKGSIYACSWSPDSKSILTVSGDKTAKIWDVEEGTVTKTVKFTNHKNFMQLGALWHKDYLLSVSLTGAINYLDKDSGEITQTIQGAGSLPSCAAKDPDSKNVYVGCGNGKIVCYDENFQVSFVEGNGHSTTGIKYVALNCNGSQLYSVACDRRFIVSDTKSMEFGDEVQLDGQPQFISAATQDPTMCALALDTGDKIAIIKDGAVISTNDMDFSASAMKWNGDDTVLYVGSNSGAVYEYAFDGTDLKYSEEFNKTINGPINEIRCHGKYVSAVGNGQIGVYMNRKLKNRSKWEFASGAVKSHAWNPAGTLIASVGADRHLYVFLDLKNFRGKRKVYELAHHGGALFAEWLDDATLVTLGTSGALKVWTVNTN